MSMKLRDAVLGAATVALLLYAAVTAARSMSQALQPPAQARASCATAAPACRHDSLQLARGH
jgi:hypothetical protein